MRDRIDSLVAQCLHAEAEAERVFSAAPTRQARDELVAALLAVADACRSRTRDGDPEITSEAQLAECTRVVERLRELGPADGELARRAGALAEQARSGQDFHWSNPTRTAAVIAFAVVLALTGATYGGVQGDAAVIVVAAVLGSALLFVTVATARRPAWRVRAELMAPVIRHHGI